MGIEDWWNAQSLNETIKTVDTSRRPDFFVLVRALERLNQAQPRVGDLTSGQRRLQFRHDPSQSFPLRSIKSVAQSGAAGTPLVEVVCTFLGLIGFSSPLPNYFTEEVASARNGAHERLTDFFDIFHDHLLSLLYRVVADSRLSWYAFDDDDKWSNRILRMLSIEHSASSLPRHLLLRLSPVLVSRARTPQLLEFSLDCLVSDLIGKTVVRLSQFTGKFVELDESQQLHLGDISATLGVDAILGNVCYHSASRINISIGPLNANQVDTFSRDEIGLRRITDLLEEFCISPVTALVELVLDDSSLPTAMLGESCLGADFRLEVNGGPDEIVTKSYQLDIHSRSNETWPNH